MGEITIRYEWDDAYLSKHPVISYNNITMSCDDNDVDIRETIQELLSLEACS